MIAEMTFTTTCWSCLLAAHPGGVHDWADAEDVRAMAPHDPRGEPCPCPCSATEPEDPEPEITSLDAQACPACGAGGACAYDIQGRTLIHASTDEESE